MAHVYHKGTTELPDNLQFWVLDEKSNGDIQYVNIFDAYYLMEFLNKQKKRHPTREEFDEMLDRVITYYFWAKCEHEVIVSGWPNEKHSIKLDKHEQIKANWHLFEPLCWNYVSAKWTKRPEEYSNRPKPNIW